MRIEELRLERFGHFADVTVPIAPEGMTLLYGANEAGKSTLLAALRIFLFGFPRGTSWDFRHPAESLAVAGKLAFSDGAQVEARRDRKRLRGKLGASDVTDELWRARLGSPSDSLFSTVFAFSLEDLAQGGERLRDEGLRAALAGAGLGAARSPEALIAQLRAQAESLFTVKGRSGKLINATLQTLKEQHEQLRKAQLRGDEYKELVRAGDEARAEAERLRARRGELYGRIGRLEALLRALPRRDELRGAAAERARLSPPPGLPPSAGADFERLVSDRQHLDEQARELEGKLTRTQQELDGLDVDETLLAAAGRVAPLHEHLGRHAKEASEATELTAGLRAQRTELSRRLGALRKGWALDELDVLPHPLFTTSLERLREGWSAHRERAQELERLTSEQRRLDDERLRLRRRLDPPWRLDAGDAFLPVPRLEELRKHRAEHERCDRALDKLRQDEERLRQERLALQSQLERLGRDGAVPSPDELCRLRAERDALWSELRRALVDGKPPPEWLDRFESALRLADAHADELRRRSDDVAKRAEGSLRLSDVERALADREQQIGAATEARGRAEAAWREAWARCGFLPASPDAMIEWLGDHTALRELDGERARLQTRVDGLAEAQRQYEARLGEILRTLGLDATLELSAARRVVEVVLEVQKELVQIRVDEERAKKLHASAAAYRDEVKRLIAELAPDLAGSEVKGDAKVDATVAMRGVQARLEAAKAAQQRRRDLDRAENELIRDVETVAARQQAMGEALAAWRRRAQASDDAEFAVAAAAAARAHELDREIERLRRALAEARGATPADLFDAALETAERALVEAEARELTVELEQVEAAYSTANQRVGSTTAQLLVVDGESRAALLAGEIESRRAELRGLCEQYAVVTLTRELLQRQVQRFQERHQPRLLEELSTLFAQLTEGRYRKVYQRLDADGTFVAVRSDGAEVTPQAMSTGTREQLYLALRLAYVRHYCAAAEPLPVILDDVLVNFDAGRARATLQVLAEFAARTQVLFFTCHAHLVDMAREVAGVEARALPRS
jgi:uncharacterized protein YhaN